MLSGRVRRAEECAVRPARRRPRSNRARACTVTNRPSKRPRAYRRRVATYSRPNWWTTSAVTIPRASTAAPGGARSPPTTRRPSGPGAARRPAAAPRGPLSVPPTPVRRRSRGRRWRRILYGSSTNPDRNSRDGFISTPCAAAPVDTASLVPRTTSRSRKRRMVWFGKRGATQQSQHPSVRRRATPNEP